MPRINYVIATWTGPRRKGNEPHRKDNLYYLKEHLRLLNKYKHELSQITIVAPDNPNESKEIEEFLEIGYKDLLQGTPIEVLRRENKGHSYGSYSYAYSKFRKNFDYYILVEDDYFFPINQFDSVLVSLFKKRENCGFLCGLVTPFGAEERDHAAISNGISSNEVLEKIWQIRGELPSSNFTTTYHCQSQLQFSWAFLDAGYQLHHVLPEYSIVFNDIGTRKIFGSGKPLMIPLQFKNQFEQLS
jgi:hypothetical protein